jgi:hypothetical protein
MTLGSNVVRGASPAAKQVSRMVSNQSRTIWACERDRVNRYGSDRGIRDAPTASRAHLASADGPIGKRLSFARRRATDSSRARPPLPGPAGQHGRTSACIHALASSSTDLRASHPDPHEAAAERSFRDLQSLGKGDVRWILVEKAAVVVSREDFVVQRRFVNDIGC